MPFSKALLKKSKILFYFGGTMKINYPLTPTILECGFHEKRNIASFLGNSVGMSS